MIDRGQLIMNDRGQLILIDWGLGSLACLLFVLHVSVASVGCYLCRRRLCFQFGLFVCLFVCPLDNWKSCEWILTKFLEGVGHGPGTNEFDFGDDLDHRQDPGIRSPKSGFTGLSNYQRILIKFYGELGCGLETNWLHFGDDPHHYPDPGVCYPDPGRTNCHNSIMLALGGGLCSLSTSSLSFVLINSCRLFKMSTTPGNLLEFYWFSWKM